MKYISNKSIAKTLTVGFLLSLTTMGAVTSIDSNVAYASTVVTNFRRVTVNTNMYSSRGTGTLITTVAKDSIVTLEEATTVSSEWIKVYDNNSGKTGYINRTHLAYTDEVPVTYAYGFRKTNAGINLYSERGTGTLLANIPKDTVLTLQESSTVSHTWIKVYDSKTNQVGYVNRSYLTTATEVPVTNIYGDRKTTAGINLYSDRGHGTLLTTIPKDTVLTLQEPTSVSHTWIKVYDSKTKQVGYVHRNYLTTVTVATPQSEPELSERDAKIEKVITLAKKQLGKNYVYGSAGPNTFDCSGLTYYTFKNSIGVTLPRTSSEQAKVGTKVSLSNLKRGDLVIFGSKSTGSVSHVAIYLGNNEYIHSPQTGDVVKITKTSSSHFQNKALYGRRVL